MKNDNLDAFKELKYANLDKDQESKLREFEKKFNEEFGMDSYFMVMERDK
jgi:hypothetical protein